LGGLGCDGRGASSGVLQADPVRVGVCLPSLGKFAAIDSVQKKALAIIFPEKKASLLLDCRSMH